MNIHSSVHAHPRFLITTDAAALLLVELLLFGISRFRVLVSPLAFFLLAFGVIVGFAVDVGLWYWKGIRMAVIADDVLTVYRSQALSARALTRAMVVKLKLSRLPGARHALLRLTSGRPLRIPETAFPPAEFARFLAAVESWISRR